MKDRRLLLGCVALMAVAGCGEPVIKLTIKPTEAAATGAAQKTDLHVVVTGVEDARPSKDRLGLRHHLWGSETPFDVEGGKAGDAVAGAVVDYLKARNWRAQLAKGGGAGTPGDVTVSGKLLNLAVDADSKFGRTVITVRAKMVVQAQNAADGSVVRMTLNGAGEDTVVWFDPEDAEDLVNTVLTESFQKFLANTKVENGLLRLK